ncbi:MAG: HAMP domain-containing sensor histidine kinase [Clostridiales bacterium]|nr:HAMP domain-containing sensor histidine kinase [Clostridiales bacterium]
MNQILYKSYLKSEISNSTQTMTAQALVLVNQLVQSGYMDGNMNDVNDAILDQMAETWNGRIRIIDSRFRVIKDTYGRDSGKYCVDQAVIQGLAGAYSELYDAGTHSLWFVEPITSLDQEADILGAIAVNVDTTGIEKPLQEQQENMRMLEVTFFCIILLLTVFVLQIMLKPLNTLADSIRNAAEGNRNGSVEVANYKETQRISDAFNKTWNRMQILDESRQEFVSNVAHELKTPMTSIRVLADSLNSMGEAPVELYQEFMQDISREIDRESKIIDDLLSLTRLDKSGEALNISKMNINELMELILKRLTPIANQRSIELLFESYRPVMADIDEVKLTLAVTNLVENAIKYNKEGGWVKLSLNADHQYFYIKVSDSGCGIPEDAMEHIFERFYRVDKARSRETGGTGLGLSISKSIVLLHHGAIKAYSKMGEGTTFVVRIPLNYIAE